MVALAAPGWIVQLNSIIDANPELQIEFEEAAAIGYRIYPDGSDLYKNCINSVLAPDFTGTQTLVMLTELINGITAILIPVAAALAVGCLITVVCGALSGTLLTIGVFVLSIYNFLNGDQ